MRKYWDYFTLKFGHTILHPEYIMFAFNRDAIKEASKYFKNRKVIDIGCGNMPYREIIEKKAKEYVGLDHPQTSKFYHPKVKPEILADISEKLPIKDKSYDIALFLEVLEYVKEPTFTFEEINRILKQNGKIVILSAFLYPLMPTINDRNRLSAIQIQFLLKKSGFKTIRTKGYGNFTSFWFLSLTLFLLKRVFDLIKKGNILSFVFLPFLIAGALSVGVLANIVFLISQKIKSSYPNYFPIDFLIIATKQ